MNVNPECFVKDLGESQQFYTGPLVLSSVFCSPLYNNFMLLSVLILIRLSPKLCHARNDFALSLLISFVEHLSQLNGSENGVYNVHELTHHCKDVMLHGSLDFISRFPYENYLGQIRKIIRTPHGQLAQIIHRISEMNQSPCHEHMKGYPMGPFLHHLSSKRFVSFMK